MSQPDVQPDQRCAVCGKTSPHEDERHSWGMPWLGDRFVQLTAALRELHRAVTEDDGSDADHARLLDAISEAQRLAPYEREEPDPNGF